MMKEACGPNGRSVLAVAMEALLDATIVQMLTLILVLHQAIPWEPPKVSTKFATCIHAKVL